MSDETDKTTSTGDGDVWRLISTLVAGPVVWGGIGYLVDWANDSRIFLPIGLGFGFVLGFYIVYVRHGRG
ncbi:putative F0F1-ATPase subunit (ATPase_gene1) [Streptoalloteichus tenebrarius]|uniref:ATP synthase protein I n=2 Tax=Streptoalloteichus TaxID=2016 RepID=A0A1M5GBA6_STRHI|nr:MULTISPECIES: hypothetical protein [Streptoalloteichus]MCP2260295.1 putative F0F1-ATPase subunit (ATPase_gene1) [Streptoalloteichus tenebrarius]BFF03045.1 hypothetical protein GCM10020241_47200 [Streptoalloteichus tenebrarius]SHG00762.1 ATP synthase protein I [Streptoalloteichus hindustanus]